VEPTPGRVIERRVLFHLVEWLQWKAAGGAAQLKFTTDGGADCGNPVVRLFPEAQLAASLTPPEAGARRRFLYDAVQVCGTGVRWMFFRPATPPAAAVVVEAPPQLQPPTAEPSLSSSSSGGGGGGGDGSAELPSGRKRRGSGSSAAPKAARPTAAAAAAGAVAAPGTEARRSAAAAGGAEDAVPVVTAHETAVADFRQAVLEKKNAMEKQCERQVVRRGAVRVGERMSGRATQ